MDLSTLPSVTTGDLSQPVTADFYARHGATPEQAAALASQHNQLSGRGGFNAMADAREATRNMPPPATPAAPPATTNAQLADATVQHQDAQLAGLLDAQYAPPANAWDYRIPTAQGTLTPEAMAADRVMVETMHAEKFPLDIGNAVLRDLNAGRGVPKSLETVAALKPTVQQMLDKAQAHPALKQFAQGLSADLLIHALSPETVIAMMPWVQYRAGKL